MLGKVDMVYATEDHCKQLPTCKTLPTLDKNEVLLDRQQSFNMYDDALCNVWPTRQLKFMVGLFRRLAATQCTSVDTYNQKYCYYASTYTGAGCSELEAHAGSRVNAAAQRRCNCCNLHARWFTRMRSQLHSLHL